VFATGLTDVGVELTVVDTVTAETWQHVSAGGTAFAPVFDSDALGGCP
jgi:hypothetical protein